MLGLKLHEANISVQQSVVKDLPTCNCFIMLWVNLTEKWDPRRNNGIFFPFNWKYRTMYKIQAWTCSVGHLLQSTHTDTQVIFQQLLFWRLYFQPSGNAVISLFVYRSFAVMLWTSSSLTAESEKTAFVQHSCSNCAEPAHSPCVISARADEKERAEKWEHQSNKLLIASRLEKRDSTWKQHVPKQTDRAMYMWGRQFCAIRVRVNV